MKKRHPITICTAIALLLLIGILRTNYSEQSSEMIKGNPLDEIAVALKTGQEVVMDRVPIQLVTFLKRVKHLVVVGDYEGLIGEYVVKDVCSSKQKRSTERLHENQTSIGWIQ
jgi:hypothetical protein